MISTGEKILKISLASADDILSIIAPAVPVLKKFAKNYKHYNPWKLDYAYDSEFWFYRVRIGAVGRIHKVDHIILLGQQLGKPAKPIYFVTHAHYYIFRVVRVTARRAEYIKKLEHDVNTILNPRKMDIYKNHFHVDISSMEHAIDI